MNFVEVELRIAANTYFQDQNAHLSMLRELAAVRLDAKARRTRLAAAKHHKPSKCRKRTAKACHCFIKYSRTEAVFHQCCGWYCYLCGGHRPGKD